MLELTVYVAESDAKQREETINALSDSSFIRVVGESGDGKVALDEILTLKPDAVITGIVLPGLDGFGLLGKLKEYDAKSKVIVISALTGKGFITRAMEEGAYYYMVEPVDYKNLQDVLDGIKRGKAKFQRNSQTVDVNEKNLEERITNIFISVGIPAHIKGYQFLREAIKLAIEKPEIINSITKQLYPSIARSYDTTPSKVERAIRHAIEVAWNKGRIENINNLFGVKVYTANDKPTNGEFIALVADKMLIENM